MTRASLRVILLTAVGFGLSQGADARAAVTDAEVRAGIDKLVKLLYSKQNEQGHWDTPQRGDENPHMGRQYGGKTALITYALLTAGQSYQDPKLQRAVEFLQKVEMRGTYAVGLRAHVWAALPPRFEPYLARDARWLAQAQHQTQGHYNYTETPGPQYDNSVTQYGVLGMWEAAKRGLIPSLPYWRRVEEHFFSCQNDNGGWGYRSSDRDTGSMTAAGLACLYIVQDFLHRRDYLPLGRTDELPIQRRIQAGLDWFGRNYAPDQNPKAGRQWLHYYLYGLERVGLASGVKYFGGENWYASGADWLLDNHTQEPVNIAFSLLFLVRGRYPVFINKLQIPDYPWNNRPRDIAQLTDWVSDQVEQRMLWQVVSIETPAEDWLDAPILYLAGHTPLELDEEQKAKLRRFVRLGGLLVTTADGGHDGFNAGVEGLMAELFPQYAMQPVPPDDELLNIVFKLGDNPARLEPLGLRTVHNGVRHLALHIPTDVSWRLHAGVHSDPTIWQLFTNAYQYATEKGRSRPRLDSHFTARRGGRGEGAPKVTVGRARHGGNWNPEPLAWEVQSNVMYNAGRANIAMQTVDLADLPDPDRIPFVHIVGTQPIDFTADERRSIGRYAESGGLILFENAGGRGGFADAAVRLLADLFPDNPPRPLGLQSPLITGQGIGGHNVAHVEYRPYALLRMGRVEVPRLLAIHIDDEPRILISGEDLTEAMLDQPVWGVFGYSSDSAHKIMSNLVLSVAPPPPPAPLKRVPQPDDGAKKKKSDTPTPLRSESP